MNTKEIRDRLAAARYLREGEEYIEDVYRRVARTLANNGEEEDVFFQIMKDGQFLPNSPTLMNAGTPLGQLSACFVLPIGDSIEEIFDAVKAAALIHKSGGGTGFICKDIRPAGSKVASTNGVASGPVSFLRVFNEATEQIKQGGRRRGANIAVLPWDHPDIEEFVTCKQQEGKLANFNISVMLDNEFMDRILQNDPPCVRLLDLVIDGIYRNGEPGVLFYNAINQDSPPGLEIHGVNPCGEQPLLPYESCNLGSVNLAEHFKRGGVNWEKLARTVWWAVLFLNRVIEKNHYPLDEIEWATKRTRKIGLGVMGWHDLLLKMRLPYDSPAAINLAQGLMEAIRKWADAASLDMAKSHGSGPAPIYLELDTNQATAWNNRANYRLTCVAPTGSIAKLAGCSTGIEPAYSWAYNITNTVLNDEKNPVITVVHPIFAEELRRITEDLPDAEVVYQGYIQHALEFGTIQDTDLPDPFKNLFKSALDILPRDHILMQATFQRNVDAGISKTINLPPEATKDEIRRAIILAWELGCKGLTMYRDGSRTHAVYTRGENSAPDESPQRPPGDVPSNGDCGPRLYTQPLPRCPVMPAITYLRRSGCGELTITFTMKEGEPFEVFVSADKGGCDPNLKALGRILSTALRSGVDLDYLIRQLKKVRCPIASASYKQGISQGYSCAWILGDALEQCVEDFDLLYAMNCANGSPRDHDDVTEDHNPSPVTECLDCGAPLHRIEGCYTCDSCGYSRCK